MSLFAIKSCAQGVLHDIATENTDNDIKLDYVNTFSVAGSEDVLEARADGKTKITLSSNKAYTFTVDMEVLDEDGLMLLLGAERNEAGELVVGSSPSTIYSYTGVFNLTMEDGTTQVKRLTIAKCKPQIGQEVTFSSIDLSTFSLTFDILTDEDGNFFTIGKQA